MELPCSGTQLRALTGQPEKAFDSVLGADSVIRHPLLAIGGAASMNPTPVAHTPAQAISVPDIPLIILVWTNQDHVEGNSSAE